MSGKLIVIEGLDGSGKATQAGLLAEALRARGKPVRQISFPVYDSESSALVRMYLRGDFGQDPGDVNAYAASVFYAADRFASWKTDWGRHYEDGGIIVADRYTTSNAIHQCSKLPEDRWSAFLDWLFEFEYGLMGIPAPERVIYLRGDLAVSQELMTARYRGDESKKDIHEKNAAYMARSRQAAEYCREALGWTTVECIRDGKMRGIGEIHREILGLV